nr:PREDICTED: ras-associated and pleckstrin homology domains-containing protein 1 isoform X2 [Latimeria chalumnae]|eukprot:XP_014345616.1 PREDICTED: ras-associated and pleckstrin homology domains-containing protein 1 isoform X2 [Latimeria chalumnae]
MLLLCLGLQMEQLSDEEVDHGAEEDSDKEDQDLDKMFGAWLGELDKLTQSLDTEKPPDQTKKSPLRQETNLANFSYRFSMYNLNEALNQGETVDLDALMADLCSIEQELSSIGSKSTNNTVAKSQITDPKAVHKPPAGRVSSKQSSLRGSPSSSIRASKPTHTTFSLDDITAQLEQASLSMDEAARQSSMVNRKPSVTNLHRRTGSAGTVSDTEIRSISNSSRSSITSAASSMDSLDIDKVIRPQDLDLTQQGQPTTEHSYLDRETSLILRNIAGKPSHLLTKEEQAAKLKAEKIRVALEKIKEAQVKKLVIRVHMSDDSSKTMMVDERQTVRQVLDNLMDKSHCGYSLDWSLVETIPELQMERIFEDQENLVENLLNWTRDSQNKLMFVERIEKYALFKNPQNYLLGKKETSEMGDRNKEALLEECFCGSSVTVPEIEGVLWLKEDGKKSWKKRYFLLRASGIYYVPKGKAKVSRDLVCFLQLDHVNVYYGQDYRSKYKAPTDYCLVLKHPQIQKKSQYIKYLCCDDVRTLHQWVNGIRIAKYGKQLYVNYQEAMKRTEAAYDWSSLSSSSMKSGSSSSSLPESHSNHSNQSNQSDSGVSDTQPAGHVRSQSIVSSIFSEAWKRGTQLEEFSKARTESVSRAFTSPVPPLSPQTRVNSSHIAPQPTPPPPPPPPPPPNPPPPPAPTLFAKYSTITRLQNAQQGTSQFKPPVNVQQILYPHPPSKPQMAFVPAGVVPTPPPPPPPSLPPPGSAMAILKPGPPSPALPQFTPPPPPPPPQQQPQKVQHAHHNNISLIAPQAPTPPPPAPPPPPPVIQPPSKPFAVFPPQTAPKPAASSVTQIVPSPPPSSPAPPPPPPPPPLKKQHSFPSAQIPPPPPPPPTTAPLPPPVLPKQQSFSSKTSLSPQSPVPSMVKQIANQFPPPPPPPPEPQTAKPAPVTATPQSPPAVKAKPKWQPNAIPSSPEFPPPPPESSLAFPPPPSPPPVPVSPPAPPSPVKMGSPVKKANKTSSPGGKKPPPTPQRNSSIKSTSSAEYYESKRSAVDSLVSKFGQSSEPSGSPSRESPPPPAPPKPGKLNLSGVNLPIAFSQGGPSGKASMILAPGKEPSVEFPSPPSDCDFPPPPPELELLPPPPPPNESSTGLPGSTSPKVAVVNPQPQTWSKSSLKKAPPPTLPKRSDSTRLTQSEAPEPPCIPQVPTSPKSNLTMQPAFLADLNRTLQRKSITRHSSLSSARMSKTEPATTMDDMALPPPPPELLLDQQKAGAYVAGNISGYATLRRGPPPAPPKRDQNTKLSRDW